MKFNKEDLFIYILIILCVITVIPVNYYITTGGGISNVGERIELYTNNKTKGSFNLSYVTSLRGRVGSYLLSYIIPNWERESFDGYKYSKEENVNDLQFRSDFELKQANLSAVISAYTAAGLKVEIENKKMYVLAKDPKYKTDFKIGDQIVSADGIYFSLVARITDLLDEKKEGDTVNFKIIRNGKEKEIKTALKKMGNRLGIGILVGTDYDIKTNPKVKFKFKNDETGPSAGLMTSLEIYNRLVNEDLTKGRVIAGTGTISSIGEVGEIGGVKFKLLGAEKKGANIFLCPKANYKEALKVHKKNKMKIKLIPVETLNDAIEKLKA